MWCNATVTIPKSRKPEDREQYKGVEGLTQQQKDHTYLMIKELSDKCTTAKIDVAVVLTEENTIEIKRH
jgi:hypothetical protein